jgi:TRAP-type mannitol/chloroaromatic compound transport system permease small subunit
MRRTLRIIDAISTHTAGVLKYFCYALVLVVTYNVIMRYVFNNPPQWAYDISIMLGGTIYVLAWGYTHLSKSHVRVDVIYSNLPPRGRALTDVLGTIFLTLPLVTVLIIISYAYAAEAWQIGERWKETSWYPPMAPFRTMVIVAFFLFLLQVIAHFIRNLRLLVKKEPYD